MYCLKRLCSLLYSTVVKVRTIVHTFSNAACNEYVYSVTVNPPWKLHTYVPEGSFVFMTCSVESGQDAYWLIDSYHFHRPLSKARLNGRGFYEVDSPHNNPHVIQLAINNTHNINGTSIKCIDVAEDGANDKIFQTTVVVYGKQEIK